MRISQRIHNKVNYTTGFNMSKALNILYQEYAWAKKNNNENYIHEIIETTQEVYQKISNNKLWHNRTKKLLGFFMDQK